MSEPVRPNVVDNVDDVSVQQQPQRDRLQQHRPQQQSSQQSTKTTKAKRKTTILNKNIGNDFRNVGDYNPPEKPNLDMPTKRDKPTKFVPPPKATARGKNPILQNKTAKNMAKDARITTLEGIVDG